MVEQRKISWRTYVVALVITVLVFTVGVLLGAEISRAGAQSMANDLERLGTETTTLELLLALNASEQRACPLLSSQVTRFDSDTSDFGRKLAFMEKKNGREDSGVQALKRQYSLREMRDYLLLMKINALCGHRFDTVLYFYTNKDCIDCGAQGDALTELKRNAPDRVMVYSFDADIGGATVGALIEAYGVTRYPSLVVNGRLFEGLRQGAELAAITSQR